MLKDLRNQIADFVRGEDAGADEAQALTEEARAVAIYAEMHELKSRLKALEKEGRELVVDLYEGYGKTALTGTEGVIVVSTKKGAKRLDTTLARKFLTPEEVQACTIEGKPSMAISFKPSHEDA
jgi:hypothetical protein